MQTIDFKSWVLAKTFAINKNLQLLYSQNVVPQYYIYEGYPIVFIGD